VSPCSNLSASQALNTGVLHSKVLSPLFTNQKAFTDEIMASAFFNFLTSFLVSRIKGEKNDATN
jgi:hypothetical protein